MMTASATYVQLDPNMFQIEPRRKQGYFACNRYFPSETAKEFAERKSDIKARKPQYLQHFVFEIVEMQGETARVKVVSHKAFSQQRGGQFSIRYKKDELQGVEYTFIKYCLQEKKGY